MVPIYLLFYQVLLQRNLLLLLAVLVAGMVRRLVYGVLVPLVLEADPAVGVMGMVWGGRGVVEKTWMKVMAIGLVSGARV
jgi:hypothetical protein